MPIQQTNKMGELSMLGRIWNYGDTSTPISHALYFGADCFMFTRTDGYSLFPLSRAQIKSHTQGRYIQYVSHTRPTTCSIRSIIAHHQSFKDK